MFSCLWPHRLQLTSLLCPNYLPEFAQTHVQWVGVAIRPFHPMSHPSLAFNLFQHQGLVIITSDGNYWLWWRAKAMAVMEVYCIYRKALSHTKSTEGSRWGKAWQKVGDLENIFKYLYPTLVNPEFSKTLF